MQSKTWSIVEAITNGVVGYIVGVLSQMVILPLYGIQNVSIKANMGMAGMFMVTSIIRGYYMRRLFNWLSTRLRKSARVNNPDQM